MQKFLCSAALSAGFLVAAAPASAQSSVCVYLEVGAWYAAEMRVNIGDAKGDWTGSFAIGQHKCKSLDAVSDGQSYSVDVRALAGNTATCNPSNLTRDANFKLPLTFFASKGTTFSHSCDLLQ